MLTVFISGEWDLQGSWWEGVKDKFLLSTFHLQCDLDQSVYVLAFKIYISIWEEIAQGIQGILHLAQCDKCRVLEGEGENTDGDIKFGWVKSKKGMKCWAKELGF